jgi:hypothetical protein
MIFKSRRKIVSTFSELCQKDSSISGVAILMVPQNSFSTFTSVYLKMGFFVDIQIIQNILSVILFAVK